MQAVKVAGLIPLFLKSQLWDRIPYPTYDFSGQTVIITGANSGLGREAARHVARLGAAKTILAVRTISKGEDAAQDIVQSCQVPQSAVEVWELDMANTQSIKAFATRAARLDRLDAVILNAGVLSMSFQTISGIEQQVAVNSLGTLLLATLLIPTLKNSSSKTSRRGRLTLVGSDLMYVANITELETDGSILDKINDREQSEPWGGRYPLTKILLYWSLRELARRNPLDSKNQPLLTAMTPGACESSLMRDDVPALAKLAMATFTAALSRTTEVGGRTLVHAVSPGLSEAAHGRFLMDEKIGYDGLNVTSAQGKRLAAKWNEELFAKLQELQA